MSASVPGFGFLVPGFWAELRRRSNAASVPDLLQMSRTHVCNVVTEMFADGIVNSDDQAADTAHFCPPLFDNASCFPASPPNRVVSIPCMHEFQGVPFDTSKNATRVCHGDGTWASLADYGACLSDLDSSAMETRDTWETADFTHTIYLVGYTLSLLALTLALIIFASFKELRCLRNKIHSNLFVTFWLSNTSWVIAAIIQTFFLDTGAGSVVVCAAFGFLRLFHLTTFFWMFVEGLYLFLQVRMPLRVYTVKLRHYMFIGWGSPLLVVLLWSVLVFLGRGSEVSASPNAMLEDAMLRGEPSVNASAQSMCLFFSADMEWVYKVPVCLLLLCNLVFLICIMSIVVSKLRHTNVSHEPGHGHAQHWKATKALLIIFPLLGITYLITIMPPNKTGITFTLFQHLRALLLSTQGFVITLPYCFLNGEVRSAVDKWRHRRLGGVQGHQAHHGEVGHHRGPGQGGNGGVGQYCSSASTITTRTPDFLGRKNTNNVSQENLELRQLQLVEECRPLNSQS